MRYFFHIRDGVGLIRDEEGMELPDIAAAHREALASARDVMLEDVKAAMSPVARWVEITDAQDRVLASIAVREIGH